MGFVIAFLVGVVLGVIVFGVAISYVIQQNRKILGTIRVNDSDPDEPPYLFLELKTSVDDILNRKIVMFDVSQK